MMRLALTALMMIALLPVATRAEDSVVASEQTLDAQTLLKKEGFYYGEIDGIAGEEMAAAIRRYQIRNGLAVSGELDAETRAAMGLESATPGKPKPAPRKPSPPPATMPTPAPMPPPAPPKGAAPDDRQFLESIERPAPGALPVSRADLLAGFLSETPFARYPGDVQLRVVQQVQLFLAREGYYREPIDGIPGPATANALALFQRDNRLVASGRLDARTWAMLPVARGQSGFRFPWDRRPAASGGAIRGIWVR